MEMNLREIVEPLMSYVPNLLGALAILIVGWLVALIAAAIVRAALRRTNVDNKLASLVTAQEGAKAPVEKWVSKVVYYLIMLFVLVAFLQALGLTLITEPLNRFLIRISEYAPRLIGPVILLLVAWVLATVLGRIVSELITRTNLDERLGSHVAADQGEIPLSKTLGDVTYWLIFLLVLPGILEGLGLEGLLEPVLTMVNKLMAFLPNLLAAAVILAVGWFVARIVQRVITNLLAAVGLDNFSDQMGMGSALGAKRLSALVGLVIYILILIPVLIAALGALGLETITQPASGMLSSVFDLIPALFGAALILVLSYIAGKVVSGLVSNLLSGIGFNNVLSRLGLGQVPGEGKRTPSEIVGSLVLVAILLFAGVEAVRLLGFDVLGELLAQFTVFAGQIILGLIIFALGLFLANLASRAIQDSTNKEAALLAVAARVAILVLTAAMALRQMGIANEIINLAFGLLLGAVAVSIALAFGLGGRDIAARELKRWLDSAKSSESEKEK